MNLCKGIICIILYRLGFKLYFYSFILLIYFSFVLYTHLKRVSLAPGAENQGHLRHFELLQRGRDQQVSDCRGLAARCRHPQHQGSAQSGHGEHQTSAVMYGGFQGGPQLDPPDAERRQFLGQPLG